MKPQNLTFASLAKYVDYLQSNGDYTFTQKDAKQENPTKLSVLNYGASVLNVKENINL